MRNLLLAVGAALGLLLMSAGRANAEALIRIDDSVEGTISLTVLNSGANQGLVGDPVFGAGNESVSFVFDTGLNAAVGQGGTYYADFFEPDHRDLLSDRLVLVLQDGSPLVSGNFVSDSDEPGGVPFQTLPGNAILLGNFIEDGTFQHVATYFDLGSGEALASFFVASDTEVPTPTAAAAGLGLIGLFGTTRLWLRRRG